MNMDSDDDNDYVFETRRYDDDIDTAENINNVMNHNIVTSSFMSRSWEIESVFHYFRNIGISSMKGKIFRCRVSSR